MDFQTTISDVARSMVRAEINACERMIKEYCKRNQKKLPEFDFSGLNSPLHGTLTAADLAMIQRYLIEVLSLATFERPDWQLKDGWTLMRRTMCVPVGETNYSPQNPTYPYVDVQVRSNDAGTEWRVVYVDNEDEDGTTVP